MVPFGVQRPDKILFQMGLKLLVNLLAERHTLSAVSIFNWFPGNTCVRVISIKGDKQLNYPLRTIRKKYLCW